MSGTSVPISGGAGDNLPAQSTSIVAAPTTVLPLEELTAGALFYHVEGVSDARPLDSGSTATVRISNGSSSASSALKVGVAY